MKTPALLLIIFLLPLRLIAQYNIANNKAVVFGLAKEETINLKKGRTCCQGTTEGMYLRKYINNKIALEAGMMLGSTIKGSSVKSQKITLPVTAQYYFTRLKKVQPYIGAGVSYTAQSTSNTTISEIVKPVNISKLNVHLVQGLNYQISTKIEINESIHVVPQSNSKCTEIGIMVGLGIHL